MKKIITLTAIILMSIVANAQQRFEDGIYSNNKMNFTEKGAMRVSYSYPLDFGVGLSHINMKDGFTSQWNGYNAPSSFWMIEWSFFGFYFAQGYGTTYTQYDVLGWEIKTSSDYYRFGFELGKLYWGNDRSKNSLSVTPFYAIGSCGLSDTSGNLIGWNNTRQIDAFRQKITHFGAKVAYSYNGFEIGLIASKNELSVSFSFIIDYRAFCLF